MFRRRKSLRKKKNRIRDRSATLVVSISSAVFRRGVMHRLDCTTSGEHAGTGHGVLFDHTQQRKKVQPAREGGGGGEKHPCCYVMDNMHKSLHTHKTMLFWRHVLIVHCSRGVVYARSEKKICCTFALESQRYRQWVQGLLSVHQARNSVPCHGSTPPLQQYCRGVFSGYVREEAARRPRSVWNSPCQFDCGKEGPFELNSKWRWGDIGVVCVQFLSQGNNKTCLLLLLSTAVLDNTKALLVCNNEPFLHGRKTRKT